MDSFAAAHHPSRLGDPSVQKSLRRHGDGTVRPGIHGEAFGSRVPGSLRCGPYLSAAGALVAGMSDSLMTKAVCDVWLGSCQLRRRTLIWKPFTEEATGSCCWSDRFATPRAIKDLITCEAVACRGVSFTGSRSFDTVE